MEAEAVRWELLTGLKLLEESHGGGCAENERGVLSCSVLNRGAKNTDVLCVEVVVSGARGSERWRGNGCLVGRTTAMASTDRDGDSAGGEERGGEERRWWFGGLVW